MKNLLLAAVILGTGSALVACDSDNGTEQVNVAVSFTGLPTLGADYVYEGWLITPDGPVSAGRFTDPAGSSLAVDKAVYDVATAYVLTIEPALGDDPAPSDTHVVAGDLTATGGSLDTAHAAALGHSHSMASGSFILETPTSDATSDYDLGIWYLQIDMGGPVASLDLPDLPAGWVYEGWVVVGGTPMSTGRFSSVDLADADGAGDGAGPGMAPPFPGQDYIDSMTMLTGGTAVISIEPDPDDSPEPFALKPLVGDITMAGAGTSQALTNNASATAITGTVTVSAN